MYIGRNQDLFLLINMYSPKLDSAPLKECIHLLNYDDLICAHYPVYLAWDCYFHTTITTEWHFDRNK